jgi:hypothetical protein
MEKTYTTPHGKMECFENYLVFYLSSNGISGSAAKEILSYANNHYGKRKYVFISNRNFASPIEPEAYKAINPKYMVGLAIVSESDAVKKEAYNEQELYSGSFSFFSTVKEAINWANTVVKKA